MIKRIFQLGYALNLAGTETVFMNWYRNVDRQKIQFDFGVMQQYNTPHADEIKRLGGRIFIIPAGHGIYQRLRFLYHLYFTLKRNGPYEAFQSHDHFFAGFTCMIAWMVGIKKRITISHYADGENKINLLSKLCRFFSRLLIKLFSTYRLAVSKKAGETLYGKNLPFQIIHNGINLNKFAYNPSIRKNMRLALNIDDKFIVGHIGRFEKQKNHLFLIDIFAMIYKTNPQAILLCIGEGSLEPIIHSKVEQLGLSHAVHFLGSKTDIQNWYQVFDVFLLPSLFEGLPLVAIEAQCSGLPCFLSDTIATETAVCNTCFLPLSGSASLWASTISKTLKHFIRTNQKSPLQTAGFDAQEVGNFIQHLYIQ